MSNYFTVLSDDWVQPQKAVYVPPSRRKEEPKVESGVEIKKDDFPDFGSKPTAKKEVLKMSSICFKEKSEEQPKTINQTYNKDEWLLIVTKDGKRIKPTEKHIASMIETANNYDEDEANIPDLVYESKEENSVASDLESLSDDSDYYEVKEEIDIPSKEEMDKYVGRVEKLKKNLGTNLNKESVQKGLIKVMIANQVKVFTEF